MSEESSFSNYPSYGEKNSRKSHFVAIFFIILFVVVIILVGLYFLGASKKGAIKVTPVTTPTPVVSQQTPTPTPAPVTLDRSKLNIAVLNGSGVEGAAKGISTTLSDLGYTVKKVDNAERFDYKGVTIYIKKEKSNYEDMLKKDLAGKATSITVTVDNSITQDAEVVVGK